MKAEYYLQLKLDLISEGYAHEIDWIADIKPCNAMNDFVGESIWVILNSGMKEQIARMIWDRIKEAWANGNSTSSAFGHKGKVAAIDYIKANGISLFRQYRDAIDKLSYLE